MDPTKTEDRENVARCTACGSIGKKVSAKTIRSLLLDAPRARIVRDDGFRFCATADCSVAYFHPDTEQRIDKSDVRVPIFQKESNTDRPLCYCFGHSVADVLREPARLPEEIASKCRQGLDRCEELNPQGRCCLGNVHRVVRLGSTDGASKQDDDCCAPLLSLGNAHEFARRIASDRARTDTTRVMTNPCCEHTTS